MKLSIITINYNNCAGLKKTIDSVVAQTYRDFEWIVIDGGSTDGSRALIEQNASHLSYWVSEPDHGVYHAMNKGLDAAQGEYLLFLNSGDWLVAADTLEKCQLDSTSADVLYGDSLFVYTDGLPEATNSSSELFGGDRMLNALNRKPDATPEILLNIVISSVNEFVGEAEQFDDLTMLSIRYNGPADKPDTGSLIGSDDDDKPDEQ